MKNTFINSFSLIEDTRVERTKLYPLIEIIFLAVCAIISNANFFTDIEEFGKLNLEWLRKYFEYKNGIPSHNTIGRVFSIINPDNFKLCFSNWIESIYQTTKGTKISIDGKTVRGSFDNCNNKKAIHMVSAWVSEVKMIIGQVKTEEKSNEITAIPELLKMLEITGCIITIDAMGCQKEIAQQIIADGADYALALKGNQGNLHENVKEFFEDAEQTQYKHSQFDYDKTFNFDHGRSEIREYWLTTDIDWLEEKDNWKQLNAIGLAKSEITRNGVTTKESRYYILSKHFTAKEFGNIVRQHWGIENSLHWCLDIGFREDESRIRKDDAPVNAVIVRHICMNLLKAEKTYKGGIAAKRLRAGWNKAYLEKILFGI